MPILNQSSVDEKNVEYQFYNKSNTYSTAELSTALVVMAFISGFFLIYSCCATILTVIFVQPSMSVALVVFFGFLWALWVPCACIFMISFVRLVMYLIFYAKVMKDRQEQNKDTLTTVEVTSSEIQASPIDTTTIQYTTNLKEENPVTTRADV